jgi:hypothetical protein
MTDALNEMAAQLGAELDREVARIREDRTLNDLTKRLRIAAAYRDHKAEQDAHDAREQQARADRSSELHRRLFSPPGDTASYRDALDRAERSGEPVEALQRLRRAQEMGDEEQARAFALVATERLWVDVINAYAETRPDVEEALQELWDLRADDTRNSLRRRLATTLHKPEEIAGMSEYDIDDLVASDPQSAGAA